MGDAEREQLRQAIRKRLPRKGEAAAVDIPGGVVGKARSGH
jgi:hypothetical protein